MKLPLFLKKYFWNVNFSNLDLDKNSSFIIVRILEYGDIQALRWLFKKVESRKIKKMILESNFKI